jgi:DNA-binding NtrC family response regulator
MGDRVLVVDDDEQVRGLEKHVLEEGGYSSVAAADGAAARRAFREEPFVAVILDLNLPDAHGKDLLDEFHRARPDIPVVVLTGEGEVGIAVECMRLGAHDFLQKPVDPTRLLTTLRNACDHRRLRDRVESLAAELRDSRGFGAILGDSPALRQSLGLLRKAAESEVTVLLEGESGTGKEVAARAVHAEGRRRLAPFVPVNCGAIPENLVESELFGHEKGSFTGASAARRGLFERADGGTVFLDEIGELRSDLQVKLLRVLQEGEVVPVGGSAARRVDVRVLAATNRNLRSEVAARRFRDDLFYRLSVFPVRLPPLRERGGDLLLLASTFLARFAERHGRPPRLLSAEAERAMQTYPWPGNVRELQNALERACILEEGPAISLGSLPDEIVNALEEAPGPAAPASAASEPRPAAAPPASPHPEVREAPDAIEPLEEMEKRAILRALRITGWHVREAAERLQVGKATLYRKIERYGFKPETTPG